MDAVILAGGEGTRLRPYTYIIPKPLMPIGDKAILEILMDQLIKSGCETVRLAVGYHAEYIKVFLSGKEKYNGKLEFSKEDIPLGTAGPLKIIEEKLKDNFIVVNGDTLSDINYKDFFEFHNRSGRIATIALFKKKTKIDLGIIELDDNDEVVRYIEKPSYEHYVSTGIYAFNPKVLSYIKPGEKVDFPEIVKRMLANNEKIGKYFIDGYWMDLGRQEDYEEALDIYEKNRGNFE